MNTALLWLAIVVCITQSASLSGLNLAVFSLSRLRLEAAVRGGNKDAEKILALRQDANYTLVTILWANVSINVLLTLLAESVLLGFASFFFSTVVITVVGEIIPQAFFARHAFKVVHALSPLLQVYRVLLWPVAKPFALLLDATVGPETIPWLREAELANVLRHQASHGHTDLGRAEIRGAINFMALDDLPVAAEGEPLDPRSIVQVPFVEGMPDLPPLHPAGPWTKDEQQAVDDQTDLSQKLADSGKKWVVLVDQQERPHQVINTHLLLRQLMAGQDPVDPLAFCHRPLIVTDPQYPLGQALERLQVDPITAADDVIDKDLILLWTPTEKRIITGSDILGRLLRGIVKRRRPQK